MKEMIMIIIIAIVLTVFFFVFCNFLYNKRERKAKERSLEEYLAREERNRALKEKTELYKKQLREGNRNPDPSKYKATSLRTPKNSISAASFSEPDLISSPAVVTAIALTSSYDSSSSYSSSCGPHND